MTITMTNFAGLLVLLGGVAWVIYRHRKMKRFEAEILGRDEATDDDPGGGWR